MSAVIDGIRNSLERVEEVKCLDQANASPQVAQIDAYTEDLAKNWNPTGFYTPTEMANIANKILQYNAQARLALAAAVYSTSDAQTVINQAYDYLKRNDDRAKLYANAVAAAQATGNGIISAPGFKTWVTNSLVNISQAYVTVAALDCRTSWLDTVAGIAADLVSAAKAVGGVVADVGSTVIQAAEDAGALYPILKWGLAILIVVGGGVWLWKHAKSFYNDSVVPNLPSLPKMPRMPRLARGGGDDDHHEDEE